MKSIIPFAILSILLTSSVELKTVDVTLTNYDVMYQNECPSTTTPPPTDIDDSTQKEKQENSAFCKCLAAEKAEGKSYSESQNDFSKCMQKASGDDQSHWEKIAQKYEHKYSVKVNPDSWDNAKHKSVSVDSDSSESSESSEEMPNEPFTSEAAIDLAVMNRNNVNSEINKDGNEESKFGNMALYVTLIGSSVLLFIFVWFMKGTVSKWKSREYECVTQVSESEANQNGNAYGGNYNDDDWDDNYDLNYSQNCEDKKKGKKKKISDWNQYSSV